jgi:two-component system, response regulator
MKEKSPNNSLILVVEDSDEEFELILRSFRKAGLLNPFFRCEEGEQAISYLFQKTPYMDPLLYPRPGIILLDLNLPGIDGREVLTEVKNHKTLKTIPVVILTNSDSEEDIATCYRAGANSYIRKPVTAEKYASALQIIADYWLKTVLL